METRIGRSNEEAAARMASHHRAMVEALRRRVAELGDAAAAGLPHEPAAKALANYVAGEVIPHAEAEEATIYRSAAERPELAPLVRAMTNEHGRIRRALTALVAARDGVAAYGQAQALLALFEAHAAKEDDHLVAALAEDESFDLSAAHAALAARTRELAEGRGEDDPAPAEDKAEAEGDREVELDVRELPHARRHDTIFALLGRLRSGDALVIVNDHDPLPLRYQMQALWPDAFDWEYREAGPRVWRVAIRRRPEGAS